MQLTEVALFGRIMSGRQPAVKPIQQTGLYKEYTAEVEKYKALKLSTQEKLEKRQRLDTTKNENDLLIKELTLLEDDAVLYKRSGPILVKLEVEEAKTDVQAKIRIIKDQINQIDTQIKNIEKTLQKKEKKIGEMQQKLQTQIALTQQPPPK